MVDESRNPRLLLAIEQFYFAYRAFTAIPDRILQELGLGRVHHRILYFVGRNPGLSVNDLLTILSVSKQALNAPLRKLMELGLIDVEKALYDRRMKLLRLSRKGEKLEAKLTRAQLEHLDKAFTRAGETATRGWVEVMQDLAD